VRRSFGLDDGPPITGSEAVEALMQRGASFKFTNGWRLCRRRVMGADRIEITGPADTDISALRHIGCTIEIVQFRARVFVSDAELLQRVVTRWPLDI
ncbi:MAG: hypothetical protein OXH14_16350, partial [Alphaproteobacteria bacterium]|nr:hypothetical protein [Alphaproteobacteria bacterium]